jgi:hypothetical protein
MIHLWEQKQGYNHVPINAADSRARGFVGGYPLVKAELVNIITAASPAPCYFLAGVEVHEANWTSVFNWLPDIVNILWGGKLDLMQRRGSEDSRQFLYHAKMG